jgi:hypothetical protein
VSLRKPAREKQYPLARSNLPVAHIDVTSPNSPNRMLEQSHQLSTRAVDATRCVFTCVVLHASVQELVNHRAKAQEIDPPKAKEYELTASGLAVVYA